MMIRSTILAAFALLPILSVAACGSPAPTSSSDEQAASTENAATAALHCNYKNTNIDGDTLAEQPWMDQRQTNFYIFTGNGTAVNNSGTFQERTELPCLRSKPACKVAIQERNGVFYTSGSTLWLDYDNGEDAKFRAQTDCHNRWQLVGRDLGQAMTLTISTIVP